MVGVGAGGRGLKAAAAGEEVYTEESRGERGSHWVKETSYNLSCLSCEYPRSSIVQVPLR